MFDVVNLNNSITFFFTFALKINDVNWISCFNNRELAIIIWVGAFLIWAICHKNIRQSTVDVLKGIWDLRRILLTMILYVVSCVGILYALNLFSLKLLKDLLFWFAFFAFAELFNLSKAENINYFKAIIIHSISLLIVIEYIANLFCFSLGWELVLVFVLGFISFINAFSTLKPKDASVHSCTNKILSYIGMGLFGYTIYRSFINYEELFAAENLQSLIFPILMTLMFIPYMYFFRLYAKYEEWFLRISFRTDYIKDVKKMTFRHCFVNLNKIVVFEQNIKINRTMGLPEIIAEFERVDRKSVV